MRRIIRGVSGACLLPNYNNRIFITANEVISFLWGFSFDVLKQVHVLKKFYSSATTPALSTNLGHPNFYPFIVTLVLNSVLVYVTAAVTCTFVPSSVVFSLTSRPLAAKTPAVNTQRTLYCVTTETLTHQNKRVPI